MVGQRALSRPDLRRTKYLSSSYEHWRIFLILPGLLDPGVRARLCRSPYVGAGPTGSWGAEFPSHTITADNPGRTKGNLSTT